MPWTEIEQIWRYDCFLRGSAHHPFCFVCETTRDRRCRRRCVLGFRFLVTGWNISISSLADPNIDPRVGLKQMLKRLTPIVVMFTGVIFSMIYF